MRFHKRYPLLQLWLDLPQAREIMNADSLSIARFEPSVHQGVHGSAMLDLLFCGGQVIAVLPNVEVVSAALLERERTPLVWPDAARVLGYDVLAALERRILPWLESYTLARQANEELIRRFSDALEAGCFEAARRARFIGAATYTESMAALAPYVYAERLCVRRTVAIADPYAATGAAMLSTRLARVRTDLGDAATNDLACRWFGRDIFGAPETADVTISTAARGLPAAAIAITLDYAPDGARKVSVASPVPADMLISFDPEDAPPIRTFGVKSEMEAQLREVRCEADTLPSGGSSGSILILLRDGFERASDADVDEARGLAARLQAEGFSVVISSPSTIAPEQRADLVHVFGIRTASAANSTLARFRAAGVPVVATVPLSRSAQGEDWGPQVLQACFARSRDESVLEERLELLELRKLDVEFPAARVPGALTNVDVAIVSCASEAAYLREALGFRGEIAISEPYLTAANEAPLGIAGIVPAEPFVFVHAPVEWRTSLALLVRAAANLGMPVVIAGPTVEADALRSAQVYAPERVIHFPDPTEGEIAALYRSASVFADVSWASRGHYRIARAVASGCALLVSHQGFAGEVWPKATTADPGSVPSLAAALERARGQGASGEVSKPGQAFSAVIFAYAKAQRVRTPA